MYLEHLFLRAPLLAASVLTLRLSIRKFLNSSALFILTIHKNVIATLWYNKYELTKYIPLTMP